MSSDTPPMADPPSAMIAIDPSGTIILWNAGATRLIGHAADTTLGRDVTMIVPPELRDQHRAGLQRAMSGGSEPVDPAPFELPVLRADGTVEAFTVRLTVLDTPNGNPAGAIVVMQRPIG